MRVAVITLEGSRYGRFLLHALRAAGIPVTLIVVVQDPWARRWRQLRGVARRIGWRDALLYASQELWRRVLEARAHGQRGYELSGTAVSRVESVRSVRLPELLRQHEIDLVLLGQSGIIPPDVLTVPAIGTLNAHPGVLPQYRGIDCAFWAVLNNDLANVGATVHWVDAGVDTGPIIRSVAYAWRGDETLESLSDRLYEDCVRLLVETTQQLQHGDVPSVPNTGGRQYYKMPRALRRRARRQLPAARTPPTVL